MAEWFKVAVLKTDVCFLSSIPWVRIPLRPFFVLFNTDILVMNKFSAYLISVFVFMIYSCCNEKDKALFFVIKPYKFKENESPIFYRDKNFILYNDTTIYFHKNFFWHFCGTVIDFIKPSRLYLEPDTLKTVKLIHLTHFLDSISKIPSDKQTDIICISSPKDTIRNLALMKIRSYYKNKENKLINIRKSTEEEIYVSEAKFTGQPYDISKCKWEIGFDLEAPSLQKSFSSVHLQKAKIKSVSNHLKTSDRKMP